MIVATTIIIIITIVTIVTIVTILLSLLVKDDAILHCSLYQSRGQRKINMERYWVWWFGLFFSSSWSPPKEVAFSVSPRLGQ